MTATELEHAILRIGQELTEHSADLSPTVFDPQWWSGALLDWCFKDEAFKARLFRFIDTLPALREDHQVSKLLEEYFNDVTALPSSLQWGLRAMSATRLGSRLSAKTMRYQIHQMAHTFIAGETISSALPVLERMWSEGRGCSVDLLGEASVSEVEADAYRDRCLEALSQMSAAASSWPAQPLLERDHLGSLPRVSLSVKLSALYSQLDGIDPEGSYRAVSARLRPILDLAQVLPASVTFDMEQADLKDLTLMIFTRLLSEPAYRAYPHAGIAIQAYLKDSMADVTRLLEWLGRRRTPATIRLVKGAYWDSDMIRYRQRGWPPPVFEQKVETDAAYERISRTLLNHRDLARSAFGTHNLRSLAHAEAVAQAAHVPADAYEFQMIFGMAEPLQSAVVKAGRRVRIYTPVGELLPGMAYLVRRLLENTSNESFLRKRYGQSEPLELLLAPPNEDAGPESMHRDGRPTEPLDLSDHFKNEPHSDFSMAAARAAMEDALGRTASQFGGERDYPRPMGFSPTGEEMLSRNPSRPSELVGRTRCVSPSDVGALVQACSSARSAWSDTSPDRRADIMTAAADIIRRRRFELAAWEVWETGKAWREADADVAEAIDFLEFYARGMRRLGHPRRLGQKPGEVNHQVVSPRGLAAVIAPWNFPLAIPTGMVSAALVTGNAVLFKPSERALIVGSLLVEILTEAGVPAGVLQFMPGGPDIGAALVEHADIQVIAFTGSKNVGLRILAQAAHPAPGRRTITRVIAEMGGKNAIIVDETADLDEAVTGVVASFTGYQGQKCSACSRAVVHASVYDLFLQRLTAAVASLHIGPPESPGVRMGPMIDDRARQTVRRYIEIGKLEGRLVIERQAAGEGYFVGPAVFADIRPEHRLAQEEIFGPVLAVMKADSFEEALRLANDSSYALTGGIYSRSPANLLRARKDFDVGNLYINRPITGALVGRQPFGGHRLSGVGAKAGGDDYLGQFVITKVISENTLRRGFAPANDPSVE